MPPKKNENMAMRKDVKVPSKNEVKILYNKDTKTTVKKSDKAPPQKDVNATSNTSRKCEAPNVHDMELELKQCRRLLEEKNFIIDDCKFKVTALEEIKRAQMLHNANQITKLNEQIEHLQNVKNRSQSRENELLQLLSNKDDIIASFKAAQSTTSNTASTAEVSCQSECIYLGAEIKNNMQTTDKDCNMSFESDVNNISKKSEVPDITDDHNEHESLMEFITAAAIMNEHFNELNEDQNSLMIPIQAEKICQIYENLAHVIDKLKLVGKCGNHSKSEWMCNKVSSGFSHCDEKSKVLEFILCNLRRNMISMQSYCKSLKNNYQQLTETNMDLDKSLVDSLENCSHLQSENENMKSKIEKLTKTVSEITAAKNKDGSKAEIDSTNMDTNIVSETLRKVDSVLKVNAELSELETKCDPSILQHKISEENNKSLIAADNVNRDLVQKIQELESENLVIKLAKEELERRCKVTAESFESLSEELTELKNIQNNKIRKSGTKVNQSKAAKMEHIELLALRKKCKNQKASLEKFKNLEKKLKTDQSNCQKQITHLQSETVKKDNQNKELSMNIEKFVAIKKNSEKLIERQMLEKIELKSLIEQLNAEKDVNKLELEVIQKNVSSHLKNISALEVEVKDKSTQLQTLFQEKEHITDALKRSEALCRSLKTENVVKEQEVKTVVINKNNVQKKQDSPTEDRFKATKENSLKSLRNEIEEYKMQLQTMREKYSNLDKEKKKIQQKYNEFEQKLKAQEEQINMLTRSKSKSAEDNATLLQQKNVLQKLLNETTTNQCAQFTVHLDNYNQLSQERDTITQNMRICTFVMEDMNEARKRVRVTLREFFDKLHAYEAERERREQEERKDMQNEIKALHTKNIDEKDILLFELNILKKSYNETLTNLDNVSEELKSLKEKYSSRSNEYERLKVRYIKLYQKNKECIGQVQNLKRLQRIVEDTAAKSSMLESTNKSLLREKEEYLVELKCERLLFKKEKGKLHQNIRQLKSICNHAHEIYEQLKAANQTSDTNRTDLQLLKSIDVQNPPQNYFTCGTTICKNKYDTIQNEHSHCGDYFKIAQPKITVSNFLYGRDLIDKQTEETFKFCSEATTNEISQELRVHKPASEPVTLSENLKCSSDCKQMKGSVIGVSRHAAYRKAKRQSFYDSSRIIED